MQQTRCKQLHAQANNGDAVEKDTISENEWQRWQTLYGVRRRKTFADIVEALKKHLALS